MQHGVATCSAKSPTADAIYGALAVRVRVALGQMAQAGVPSTIQEITIGPTIGAAFTLACQNIVGLLVYVAPPPPSLQPLLSPNVAPHELVAVVGNHADDIMSYIDQTLMAKPDAFAAVVAAVQHAQQNPAPPMGSPAQQVIAPLLTKDRLVAIGTSALIVGSLIWFAHSSSKRLSGRVDRSRMLEPDPVEYEDDDDVDVDPNIIDAEAVETAVEASA